MLYEFSFFIGFAVVISITAYLYKTDRLSTKVDNFKIFADSNKVHQWLQIQTCGTYPHVSVSILKKWICTFGNINILTLFPSTVKFPHR